MEIFISQKVFVSMEIFISQKVFVSDQKYSRIVLRTCVGPFGVNMNKI